MNHLALAMPVPSSIAASGIAARYPLRRAPACQRGALVRRLLDGRALLVLALCALALVPRPAQSQARELPDFTELVERVGPAVVNIRTAERGRAGAQAGGAEMDEQMREFFRRFGIPMPDNRAATPRRGGPRDDDGEPQQRGVGSGFILRPTAS